MNSKLGLISLAASLTVLALYSACSDYQEEFDSNFGALTYESYLDTSSVDLSSATDHFSSNAEEMSSGAVPVSSSVYSLSSSLQDELSSSSEEKKESSSSVEESSSSSVESLNSKKCKDPENKCIVDSRDDQVYDTVQIGNQIWMAQNLNYRTDDSYCYNAIDAQITNEYCETYGRLYRIKKTLEMTDGVCPEGWHVPSKDEWTTLFKTVGGQVHAGVHLKSKTGWQGGSSDVSGKDDFGFTALPGGLGHGGSGYQFEGMDAWFLTTSMSDSKECPTCMAIVNLFFSTEDAIFDPRVGEEAVSVRCLKDSPLSSSSSTPSSSSVSTISGCECNSVNVSPDVSKGQLASWSAIGCQSTAGEITYEWTGTSNTEGGTVASVTLYKRGDKATGVSFTATDAAGSQETVECEDAVATNTNGYQWGTVKDAGGRTYQTVKIGSQWWMAENLNYDYNHGSAKSYCYNDSNVYCEKYGRLYTWAAAMDSAGIFSTMGKDCGNNTVACSPTFPVQGICPDDWHLPTPTDWQILFEAVGEIANAGKNLKSGLGWDDEGKGNGLDSYGFGVLPAGYRTGHGTYDSEKKYADYWTSNEVDADFGHAYSIQFWKGDYVSAGSSDHNNKSLGFSVRCVMDRVTN